MNLWGKRGKFSIIADILETANGGAGKTQIMYRANLSFRQLENYLGLMLEIDFLDETLNNGRKVYDATHKGIIFLQRYYAIKELLKTEDDNSYKKVIDERYPFTQKLLLSSTK